MKLDLKEEIKIPEGTQVTIVDGVMKVKGKKGESSKKLMNPKVKIEVRDGKIFISTPKATKREKTMVCTFKAHAKNLLKGANEGHQYTLKICSGHFPMKVSATKTEFVINNFIGEKFPRKLRIIEGVSVKVEGDIVTVESVNKEMASQMAADIEQLTRRTAYDRRIFQDGIYITNKDGKDMR